MNDRIAAKAKSPCLFLFDGGAQGVKEPALSTFTGALLRAVSDADPGGTLVAELRGGVPLLSDFAAQISEVSSGPKQTSHLQTHDMALYRLLLWDMAESLSEGAGAPRSRAILDVLRMRREECLTLSDMPDHVRVACDDCLALCAGYIGCCPIDPGNPIQRRAFYDGFTNLALISEGAIIQERSIEGDEHFELEGARNFSPNGLKWADYGIAPVPDAFRLGEAPLSTRGALSVDRLKRKTQTTAEGRIFRALTEALWTDRTGNTYRFAAAESGHDILQAVLPSEKFTDYLFNRDHDIGGGKARFIIDVLGFETNDWRYLAAQLYDGLLLSEPRDLSIKRWNGGYGARFNGLVEVVSRNGQRGILRTGWMLEPQKLPRLVTVVPGRCEDGLVKPPVPPVLAPQLEGDTRWESLFLLADEHGRKAHATTLPTPMILEGYEVIEEGECGSSQVLIADARGGFARWLIKTGHGHRAHKGGAAVFCTASSQSVERAKAYARAFARVLALNGVPSRIETYFT